ncbi:copper resistance CopC family protein [Kitasatospora sp. NPDC052868]|uniref:copper resistance CopC family protein n=1 Tax=Kitasatospora sp. NPDC052868 TaxID=3364060 RepID=UPI0037CB50DF
MSATGSLRSFRRTVAVGVGVAVLLLVALAWISAREPVRLSGATPADGGAVADAPKEVALTFSGDDFAPQSVYLQVNGPDGSPVTDGAARVDGRRVVSPVRIRTPGEYLVTYRLTFGDSDVSGTTAFAVGPGAVGRPAAAPVDDGLSAHEHTMDGVWNLLLLCVDAVLLPGAVLLMLRRPRVRRDRPADPVGSG